MNAVKAGRGKSSLFIPKKFCLNQVCRKRSAVYLHQRHLGPQAVIVDRVGCKLFARSALSKQKHICVTFGHLGNEIKYFLHFTAVADDILKTVLLAKFFSEPQVLFTELLFFPAYPLKQAHFLGNKAADDCKEIFSFPLVVLSGTAMGFPEAITRPVMPSPSL